MPGYDPDFLGVPFPMPTFSPALAGEVLHKPELEAGVYAHYVNYTVVTSKVLRSPVIAALNIDQQRLQSVPRIDGWKIDSRIGGEYQLNNDYYRANDWDRGHLARRASAAWGASVQDAKRASDETFYYSNSALQHQNYNRDEWVALEDWVLEKENVKDGKLCSFSMPHYSGDVRSVRPEGRPRGFVPAGFCKVVGYVDASSGELEVRAFMILQDRDALKDLRGRSVFNFQNYQITITEVEQLTGLAFDNRIFRRNPLFAFEHSETEEARAGCNVNNLPERIEVDGPSEIVAADTRRVTIADDNIEVYLAGAMVNPAGSESRNEWVSVLNMSGEAIDISGWTLASITDSSRVEHGPETIGTLRGDSSCLLEPGCAIAVYLRGRVKLANSGGAIVLANDRGERVDRIRYTAGDARREGVPVNFFYQPSASTLVE